MLIISDKGDKIVNFGPGVEIYSMGWSGIWKISATMPGLDDGDELGTYMSQEQAEAAMNRIRISYENGNKTCQL